VEEISREVVIDAPTDEVWDAVTDPERLGDWFGADVEGEVAEGQTVHFVTPDGSDRRAVIERVDEGCEITFRYLPTDDDPSSRVVINIEPLGDGSIVRVTERRIEPAVSHRHEIGFRAMASV
jgi:uncharacterized protein YndB with AHSA1/START domain